MHDNTKTSRAGFAKLLEVHRIVRRYSHRRFPPVLLIHGGGTLYRLARRALGFSVSTRRPPFLLRWARRATDRIIETGRIPLGETGSRAFPLPTDARRSEGAFR